MKGADNLKNVRMYMCTHVRACVCYMRVYVCAWGKEAVSTARVGNQTERGRHGDLRVHLSRPVPVYLL